MNDLYIELKDFAEKINNRISVHNSERSSVHEMLPEFKEKFNKVKLKMQIIKNNNDEIE